MLPLLPEPIVTFMLPELATIDGFSNTMPVETGGVESLPAMT